MSVVRPKISVSQAQYVASRPVLAVLGLRIRAASAGLSDSALKADNTTETAMVTANCWYSRPVIPGMNAVGMNTADRTRAMPITGPEISSMDLSAASLGGRPSAM